MNNNEKKGLANKQSPAIHSLCERLRLQFDSCTSHSLKFYRDGIQNNNNDDDDDDDDYGG